MSVWCVWRALQGSRNVVYLCENFVSEACMAEKSPDACVNELIDSLGQTGGRSSGVPLAAIVAPIVVVGEWSAGLCRRGFAQV